MARIPSMATRTWLEVALNGPWGRKRQPGIPVRVADIVAEGVACAREGAAIVHVHAYDESTGRQRDDADPYARIIEGIRAQADCIVYPTIPFGGEHTAQSRYAAIEALGRRGLLECAVVDPGSVNLDGFVYLNPDDHIRHGLALAGEAAARGGHVRVGLEDAPFGTARGNLDWVRAARREIEAAGASLASAADVRAALGGR